MSEKCLDLCEELIDCSSCRDEFCDKLCEELEDKCYNICKEMIKS